MPHQLECENCGGTDFYKEAGYFYCKECQIQSQDVQEHVFEIEDSRVIHVEKTTQVVQDKAALTATKDENKITSWECYNYILLGLAQELIDLGAQPSYKTVMRILWMRYLEKLQVFSLKRDGLPKLQVVNSRMDGEIIYGKLKKRKRIYARSSSSESVDSSTIQGKRAMGRKKKALSKAHYNQLTASQQDQSTSASLHNETLTSLKTSSDKSSRKTAVSYSIYAHRELRRKQGIRHLTAHRKDFQCDLSCHRSSYRTISHAHKYGPYILSLNKLYALLYLGLLINHEKIQLGDLLRFIQEGSLSFNYYDHFFPDEFTNKKINFKNFKKNSIFTNFGLRNMAVQLANFLKVRTFINVPNVFDLTQRYCTELNLPQEMYNYCEVLLNKAPIKMKCRSNFDAIPNYEGRVLSIILFITKLLFGLDNCTEFELSKFAAILNRSKSIKTKSFEIISWLKYLEYRKAILSHHHLPTNFAKDNSVDNLDIYTDFMSTRNLPEPKFHPESDQYTRILNNLKSKIPQLEPIQFENSITPFRSHLRTLLDHDLLNEDYLHEIIHLDFNKTSLDFVLKPDKFLKILSKNNDIKIIHGGANENWIFSKIFSHNRKQEMDQLKKRREIVLAELTTKRTSSKIAEECSESSDDCFDDEKAKNFKEEFFDCNRTNFKSNAGKVKRLGKNVDLNVEKVAEELREFRGSYSEHFVPYERFWVRACQEIDDLKRKPCARYLEKFPSNFRLLLKECARIAQQTEQEFIAEYHQTEIYLTYVFTTSKNKEKTCAVSKDLQRIIDKARDLW